MSPNNQYFESSQPSVAWILGGQGLPAGTDPDKVALIWEGGELTYAQLRRSALSIARSFRDMGLKPGETVLCALFNRGETFQIYFACAYAGLRIVPASFRLSSQELTEVLNQSEARLLFVEEELRETAKDAVEALHADIPVIELGTDDPGTQFEQLVSADPIDGPFPHCDPHLVLFSSGSTGKPKGIMLSHRNILNYAIQQSSVWPGYTSEMRLLVVPAMFNTGGINEITIPAFFRGGTVCILPSRGWTAERMAGYIDRWQITHTVIFPTMFGPLFEADQRSPIGLESLRVAITGGENCPPATMDAFKQRWPHIDLAIGYGMTEGGLVSWIKGEEMASHPGSVGRVTAGQAVKIVDAEGKPLPAGSVGEIMTAGDAVTVGYWGAPGLNESMLFEGWLKTGDLGRLDEDGYLYIEGRSRDMIISKGQNIYPAEIEATLAEHPSVRDVAVVGVPDSEYGEAVCAVIVVREGATLDEREVIQFVGERIASYKKPRVVRFRDELPIGDSSNKVQKLSLSAEISAEIKAGNRPA